MHPPPPPGPLPLGQKKKPKTFHPQSVISHFWYKYHSRNPGKITSIFPQRLYKNLVAEEASPETNKRNAAQGYERARAECLARVRAAVEQCERTNTRFCDDEFDIEADFFSGNNDCLRGLIRDDYDSYDSDDEGNDNPRTGGMISHSSPEQVKQSLRTMLDSGLLPYDQIKVNMASLERVIRDDYAPYTAHSCRSAPKSVHRLDWIFESPKFTVNGFSSFDIKQGTIGDCWWLAAVGNIAHRRDLMEKICVARDEECGVYGFVFHRDGEWISTVIDDNLYLRHENFAQRSDVYDVSGKKARLHKQQKQTGSEALFFSKCEDQNETWLPLLEKAYAKVHGDYEAMEGGWAGTAVEDLTGGVTTMILANCVLRKEKLWREMLGVEEERNEFVFALSATGDLGNSRKNGLTLGHAYSILRAREIEDENGRRVRLVKVRNPWGQRSDSGFGVWHGPWSDGSREWTPEVLKKLHHEFADDGAFWMTFEDMLNNFKWIHRTRLFDERWTVAQQWTSNPVSWAPGFLKAKFVIEIKQEGMVVIVLSNLDERYFKGLEGMYSFNLEFRIKSVGSDAVNFLASSKINASIDLRSVNCEVYLQPGTYEVFPKITASYCRWNRAVEDVVKGYAQSNPAKLRKVGLQYDLAHAKAGVLDEDQLQRNKRLKQKRKKKQNSGKNESLNPNKNAEQLMQLVAACIQEQLGKISFVNGGSDKGQVKGVEVEKAMEKGNGAGRAIEEGKVAEDAVTPSQLTKSPPGCWPGDSVTDTQSNLEEDSSRSATGEERAGTESSKAEHNSMAGETGSFKNVPEPEPEPQPQQEPEPVPEIEDSSVPDPGQLTPNTDSDSDSESDSDTDSEWGADSDSEPEVDESTMPSKRWNPVCVMCLRVYAQDKEVSVRLAAGEPGAELAVV